MKNLSYEKKIGFWFVEPFGAIKFYKDNVENYNSTIPSFALWCIHVFIKKDVFIIHNETIFDKKQCVLPIL